MDFSIKSRFAEWLICDFYWLLVDDEVEIVLQVLGKNKAKLMVPTGSSKADLEKLALENDVIQSLIAGKTVRKVIAVPDKLVNIVAN